MRLKPVNEAIGLSILLNSSVTIIGLMQQKKISTK